MRGLLFALTVCCAGAEVSAVAGEKTATLVSVAPLESQVLYPQHSVPATVVAAQDSRLKAQVTAPVADIGVRVGDQVAAGALLVRLDCREYDFLSRRADAELARARASRSLAERQLKRAGTLGAQGSVSEELVNQRETELDMAAAGVSLALAQREQARLAVERCDIRAPFDGVVLERIVQLGELAAPGTPLLRLLSTATPEVSAHIPFDLRRSLNDAGNIVLHDDTSDYAVRLRTLLPFVDTRARSSEARFDFVDGHALTGSAGRVVWRSQQPHVAADLIVYRGGRPGLMLRNGARAEFVPVAGAGEGQPAPVGGWLERELIVDGRHGLADGDPIRIAD